MASVIFNSCVEDSFSGAISFSVDEFYVLLVGAAYTPDKDNHATRADVDADEIVGDGYTAGGVAAVVSVARDDANDRINVTLGAAAWAMSSITASGAIYYKNTTDNLVAFIDFGGEVTSTNGAFNLAASTLRFQN